MRMPVSCPPPPAKPSLMVGIAGVRLWVTEDGKCQMLPVKSFHKFKIPHSTTLPSHFTKIQLLSNNKNESHLTQIPEGQSRTMMLYRKRPLTDDIQENAFCDKHLGRFQQQAWSHGCLLTVNTGRLAG